MYDKKYAPLAPWIADGDEPVVTLEEADVRTMTRAQLECLAGILAVPLRGVPAHKLRQLILKCLKEASRETSDDAARNKMA